VSLLPDPVRGRVLVVDGDWDSLAALAEALRARHHSVVLATDGRSGLSRAVETSPDVVVVDTEITAVDVRTFLELLRDNPRTADAIAFVAGRDDVERIAAVDARAEPLVKPFHPTEVVARIERALARKLGPTRDPELRGDLGQVSLPDLLQVFAANRRTGTLRIETPASVAELVVHEGRVVDAQLGRVAGEKALYRALALREGRFSFLPGLRAARARIDASTDALLLESARLTDELERLSAVLPPPSAMLRRAFVPETVTDLGRALLLALDEPRKVIDLVDARPEADVDVLAELAALVAARAVVVLTDDAERVDLCDEDEAVALRAAAMRLRRPGLEGPPRLAILAADAADVARLSRALALVDGFSPAAEPVAGAGRGVFGVLGTANVGGADLELFALPLDVPFRPLWSAALAPTLVALLLPRASETPSPAATGPADAAAALDEAAFELLHALGVSVVEAPAGWSEPAGAVAALRRALCATGASTLERSLRP
jgi:DNA-binding response OmpR family regulator